MFVIRTNNSASNSPMGATIDAQTISAQNEPNYSDAEKMKGDLVERLVQATFHLSDTFKVYRKRFIAIKVCDPSAEELISDECRQLYDVCHANDIDVVHTKTGVIFRVYSA